MIHSDNFWSFIIEHRTSELAPNLLYFLQFCSQVSLAIFTTYVLIDEDNVLTANKAFVTLSLINMLSWPLSILPLGVANTTQVS